MQSKGMQMYNYNQIWSPANARPKLWGITQWWLLLCLAIYPIQTHATLQKILSDFALDLSIYEKISDTGFSDKYARRLNESIAFKQREEFWRIFLGLPPSDAGKVWMEICSEALDPRAFGDLEASGQNNIFTNHSLEENIQCLQRTFRKANEILNAMEAHNIDGDAQQAHLQNLKKCFCISLFFLEKVQSKAGDPMKRTREVLLALELGEAKDKLPLDLARLIEEKAWGIDLENYQAFCDEKDQLLQKIKAHQPNHGSTVLGNAALIQQICEEATQNEPKLSVSISENHLVNALFSSVIFMFGFYVASIVDELGLRHIWLDTFLVLCIVLI